MEREVDCCPTKLRSRYLSIPRCMCIALSVVRSLSGCRNNSHKGISPADLSTDKVVSAKCTLYLLTHQQHQRRAVSRRTSTFCSSSSPRRCSKTFGKTSSDDVLLIILLALCTIHTLSLAKV